MKFKIFIFTIIYAVFRFNQAQAECRWDVYGFPAKVKVTKNFVLPALVKLSHVPVGSVMGSATSYLSISNDMRARCFNDDESSYYIESGELAEGYSDVYKTNVAGIGIRISSSRDVIGTIPFKSLTAGTYLITNLKIDFLRISRNVASGVVNYNFTIVNEFGGWRALDGLLGGTTKLEVPDYFSGCTGVEKLNVAMGGISLADLGKTRQKPFNLDVLCSGAAAGTKIPVKVYFEGSSDGPGQLNLEPGGAKGVEISLLNDRGVKLPFSKGSALDMTWTRSEPKGEIYRLPVVAEYVKKAAQKVEPGKANATVNYILEYN